MADLPAMKTNPKYIFFTDFDGTITLRDTNDFLTDNKGFGTELRKQGNKDVLEGKMSFRESFAAMMASVHTPFNECKALLASTIRLDPHFKTFFLWATANNIPVVVLSSGMEPIIETLLRELIGEDVAKIQIVANSVVTRPGKDWDSVDGWDLVFHDESDFGHDKSRTLRPYAQLPEDRRPWMFYAGDGVSDLSAARETDLLFAKKGMDLVTYCVRESIPFTLFEDWSQIHAKVKEIFDGKMSVKEAAKHGYEEYKSQQARKEDNETTK